MTCDSCGFVVDATRPVHRTYVDSGGEGRPPSERVLADVERWCVACLTLYPHQPV